MPTKIPFNNLHFQSNYSLKLFFSVGSSFVSQNISIPSALLSVEIYIIIRNWCKHLANQMLLLYILEKHKNHTKHSHNRPELQELLSICIGDYIVHRSHKTTIVYKHQHNFAHFQNHRNFDSDNSSKTFYDTWD